MRIDFLRVLPTLWVTGGLSFLTLPAHAQVELNEFLAANTLAIPGDGFDPGQRLSAGLGGRPQRYSWTEFPTRLLAVKELHRRGLPHEFLALIGRRIRRAGQSGGTPNTSNSPTSPPPPSPSMTAGKQPPGASPMALTLISLPPHHSPWLPENVSSSPEI